MTTTIEQTTTYPYKGKHYKTTKELQKAIENELGAIVESIYRHTINNGFQGAELKYKQLRPLYDAILANKGALTKILQIEVNTSDDLLNGDYKNVFDL